MNFAQRTQRSQRWRRQDGLLFGCVLGGLCARNRFDVESEFAEQRKIDIDLGIFGGEKFVAEENGIGAGKKTERLAFAYLNSENRNPKISLSWS
jgi:hypothetical protein